MKQRTIFVSLIISIIVVLGTLVWLFAKNHFSPAINVPSGWTIYHSKYLRLSIAYPSAWNVDTSQEKQGFLTIESAPPDLNRIDSLGAVRLDATSSNPNKLTPSTWYENEVKPNVDPPLSQNTTTIAGMPAYTVVTDEMGGPRHTYIFQDTRIISVSYPASQQAFAATYHTIMNSLQIRK